MTEGNTRRFLYAIGRSAVLLCIAFFLTACENSGSVSVYTDVSAVKTTMVTTSIAADTTAKASATKTQKEPCPIQCEFFDAQLLAEQTKTVKPYQIDGAIHAAVVPHHAPHMDLLCNLLASEAIQNAAFESVIVIGPNHYGKGDPVQITGQGFYWENGMIDGDIRTADYIASDFRLEAATDTQIFETDHSVSVLMPYLAQYLPNVPVTSILLSTAVSAEALDCLCEDLLFCSDEKKTLLLFSADFSHYQTPEDTKRYDAETESAVLSKNVGAVLSYGNEHVDTPQGIALFLRYVQETGAEIECAAHRLAETKGNKRKEAMSYFVFTATEPQEKSLGSK